MSIFDNGLSDFKDLGTADGYAKLIVKLRDKIVEGLNEDVYNLKTFDEGIKKIETQLWSLKDIFYTLNTDLRKSLYEDYTPE